MPSRFIEKVSALADILDLPGSAGVGSYGGVPFARTESGLLQLGVVGPGKQFFLDPVNGLDANDGLTPATAKKTLDGTAGAYSLATAGKNDVIFLISDGATTSTARVDAAFTWAKAATHLVGLCSGVNISNRARIAPTAATTAFANFFTVSASGCLFANLQWFHGFTTGAVASIALTVTGGRNLFRNCHILGMGDAESAADAGSRCILLSGNTGENQFVDCTIGGDALARSAANANVGFAVNAARNVFRRCQFLMLTTSNTSLFAIAPASGLDRWAYFDNCKFLNCISAASGGTAITGLATLAGSAGMLVLDNPFCLGVTTYGTDATTDAQMRIAGAVVAANGALIGLSVAPAA